MKEFLDDFAVKVINSVSAEIANEENQNKLIGFGWFIKYNDMVSNTHSCPKNGVENFMCKPDNPLGYPGFSGVLWYRTEKDHKPKNTFHKFPKSLIHTGSGGEGYAHPLWEKFARYHFNFRDDKKSTQSILL